MLLFCTIYPLHYNQYNPLYYIPQNSHFPTLFPFGLRGAAELEHCSLLLTGSFRIHMNDRLYVCILYPPIDLTCTIITLCPGSSNQSVSYAALCMLTLRPLGSDAHPQSPRGIQL